MSATAHPPVHHPIAELDAVEFTVPVGPWPAGTEAVVLEVFDQGALVEVADQDGQTLDLLSVPWPALKRRPEPRQERLAV
jgi:hypothetical protein